MLFKCNSCKSYILFCVMQNGLCINCKRNEEKKEMN